MTLKRIRTQDVSLTQVQDAVDTALTPLQNGALATCQKLSAVVVPATTGFSVAHKLGHVPLVVLIGAPSVSGVVWQWKTADSTFLYLQSSVSGNTVNIVVQ